MKPFAFFFSLAFLFFMAGIQDLQAQLDVVRDGVTYKEDAVLKFKIEIPHEHFHALMEDFDRKKESGDYKDLEIAGFTFIPAWEMREGTNNFITTGFRIVLTLWKTVITGDIAQPSEITFYTFEDGLDKTFEPNVKTLIAAGGKKMIEVIRDNPLPERVNLEAVNFLKGDSPQIFETREFDLVFLDKATYLDLATSSRFYSGGTRPDGQRGIIVERALSGISDAADPQKMKTHRNLIFRPLPVPTLTVDTVDASAVAYGYGVHCPPVWRDDLTAPEMAASRISMAMMVVVQEAEEPSFWDYILENIWYLIGLILLLLLALFALFVLLNRKLRDNLLGAKETGPK